MFWSVVPKTNAMVLPRVAKLSQVHAKLRKRVGGWIWKGRLGTGV